MEIVGSLWGTLEAIEPGRLIDISPTGVLIASPFALVPDSTQFVRLMLGGEEITLDTRVRHSRVAVRGPDLPPEYLVGLEFVSVPVALAWCTFRLYVASGFSRAPGA